MIPGRRIRHLEELLLNSRLSRPVATKVVLGDRISAWLLDVLDIKDLLMPPLPECAAERRGVAYGEGEV